MRPVRILAIVILGIVSSFAQTNKGGISGTVTDTDGEAIPGATVTITNLGTNQKLTLTTSESGSYSATSLDPVNYSVMVEAQGFKRSLVETSKSIPRADITTLEGLKLYRLRQAYNPEFGALNAATSQPRYIQFGLRIFF